MKKDNTTKHLIKKAELSEDFWNKNANYWSEQLSNKQDYTREYFGKPAFLKFLGNVRGMNVLDIGCGDGDLTRIIANQALNIIGIDISQKMIDKAKNLTLHDNVEYYQSSLESMPSILKGKVFDCIYSYMVLCCIENINDFFSFSYDLLKVNGKLLLIIPHPCFNNKPCEWVTDEKESVARGLLISRYFDEESYIRKWDFCSTDDKKKNTMQEIRFPRTLSTYLNAIINSGFAIEKVIEPRPLKSLVTKLNKMNRWYDHVPCFMFIECHKKARYNEKQ